MADTVVAPAPAAVTPSSKRPKVKTPKVNKASTPAPHHPTYSTMISAAISSLKGKSGSSRQAIVKYIVSTYKVDEKTTSVHVKQALKRGVAGGELKQIKGAGASGSFKLNLEAKTPAKKTPKKAATPKKSAAKKPAVAKKTPQKAAGKAKKSPSKKTKKSPAAKKPVARKVSKPKKPAAKKLPAKK